MQNKYNTKYVNVLAGQPLRAAGAARRRRREPAGRLSPERDLRSTKFPKVCQLFSLLLIICKDYLAFGRIATNFASAY